MPRSTWSFGVARFTATSPFHRPSVDALIAAESKGAYFNTHVRNRFRYQRLA
jgi:hypothetical protein